VQLLENFPAFYGTRRFINTINARPVAGIGFFYRPALVAGYNPSVLHVHHATDWQEICVRDIPHLYDLFSHKLQIPRVCCCCNVHGKQNTHTHRWTRLASHVTRLTLHDVISSSLRNKRNIGRSVVSTPSGLITFIFILTFMKCVKRRYLSEYRANRYVSITRFDFPSIHRY
jgi:hypothetical protein